MAGEIPPSRRAAALAPNHMGVDISVRQSSRENVLEKRLVAGEPDDRECEISNRWQPDTLAVRLFEW